MVNFFRFIFLLVFFSCENSMEKFHDNLFVVDMHNDVLLRVMSGYDISTFYEDRRSDIIKFQKGGIDLQAFSIFVDPSIGRENYFKYANKMIDKLDSICFKYPNKWSIPMTYQDIILNNQKNIMSCLIGVEGGHVLNNDLNNIDSLYKRGMRYLGVTWNNSNNLGTSSKDETNKQDIYFKKGLTDFGQKVIKKCNQIGVMIDISHAGEETFWDIIKVTDRPVIASHSSVYSLCPSHRNLKDNQLKAIKSNGGVVFVNFFPGYVDSNYSYKSDSVDFIFETELNEILNIYGNESDKYWYESGRFLENRKKDITPSLDMLIEHIIYLVNLIGSDHVGLGSDFDGVLNMPKKLEDVSRMPNITRRLVENGISKNDIKKILGENFKRVFKEVTK